MNAVLSCTLVGLLALPGAAQDLKSGGAALHLAKNKASGYGLRFDFENTRFEQPAPLAIEIVDVNGNSEWLAGQYGGVKKQGPTLQAEGDIVSPRGTRFHFVDRYAADSTGFALRRRVEVFAPSSQDAGFSSRFGLTWASPVTLRDGDTLMPGVWYRDNKSIPPGAFPVNLDEQVMMLREDRLGLPMICFRNRQSGISLTLERIEGVPRTIAGDTGQARIIDGRLETGALGFRSDGHLQEAFTFPGSEDERDSASPGSPSGPRFLPRAHPVRAGFTQVYALHVEIRKTPDFASAVEQTIKGGIERAHPPLLRADLTAVYRASQDLLDTVTQPHNGTIGVPFQVGLPTGEIKDTSTQMGFVGMALPCAALLLKDGLETHYPGAVTRAESVIDFWVKNSGTPSGLPKTWVDFPAPGQVTWRRDATHLRVASDGLDGVLQAWGTARRHQLERPEWLQFARRFGDFLVEHQNEDGSWFGSWNIDGTPHNLFTNATTHPIEFLIDLSYATKDERYRVAALRAGEFCWKTVHQDYSYVGGTPDNPNVTDKEAGVMAVRAFLALYDASKDRKWLEAAKQAALFCESWVYWRDVPVPDGDDKKVFPRGKSSIGLSLIATGHSGADNYMAMAPFNWYRIYLATGDDHFLLTARLLLHDTKQIIDWDGSIGYRYPGLMPEAMTLAPDRGRGVAGWLPWLTVVTLDPMRHLQETFGTMDIDAIEKLPLAKRRELSIRFGKTRGF